MGRNRIEDRFREKLAKREITPSAGSWEKLSGQLNSEEKKPTPIFWWIGIAATVLGAVFIIGMVYNNSTQIDGPGVVTSPVEIEIEDKIDPISKPAFLPEEELVTNFTGNQDTSASPKIRKSQEVYSVKENKLLAENKEEKPPGGSEDFMIQHEEKISQKLEDIIAELSLKDENTPTPTYDEIDVLLYKAASEISLERKNINSTGTVDAGDLLFAVEMELEESFREKVFDMLKEGFLKARTAVANRNYP